MLRTIRSALAPENLQLESELRSRIRGDFPPPARVRLARYFTLASLAARSFWARTALPRGPVVTRAAHTLVAEAQTDDRIRRSVTLHTWPPRSRDGRVFVRRRHRPKVPRRHVRVGAN